jgi:hypothetical protein
MFVPLELLEPWQRAQFAMLEPLRVLHQQPDRFGVAGAALLHGKFYLAANTKSTMVRRLWFNPTVAITYFENRLLLMGHGTVAFMRRGEPSFRSVSPEWEKAFNGGRDALLGIDLFLRVDATHLVAFANRPDRYPKAWGATHR